MAPHQLFYLKAVPMVQNPWVEDSKEATGFPTEREAQMEKEPVQGRIRRRAQERTVLRDEDCTELDAGKGSPKTRRLRHSRDHGPDRYPLRARRECDLT